MSDPWRHALCIGCYGNAQPGRRPHLVVGAPAETCCGCGGEADPPVYYRAAPSDFACNGTHVLEMDDAS
jgi:hypothetical protein